MRQPLSVLEHRRAILPAYRFGETTGSLVDLDYSADINHGGPIVKRSTVPPLNLIASEMRSTNNLVGAKIQPDFAFGGRGTVGSVR